MTKTLVYGVGINDADYAIKPTINGKRLPCKFYETWKRMLERCYDSKCLKVRPTYIGCSVAKEWHSFMNFKTWMIEQDYESKHLDKDLLVKGNKEYSKDNCVFISSTLNTFLIECTASRGDLPIGVSTHGKKFRARCRNPFSKTSQYLGSFFTPEEAHLAWKKYKHELALEYAKLETDPRIIEALQNRYK